MSAIPTGISQPVSKKKVSCFFIVSGGLNCRRAALHPDFTALQTLIYGCPELHGQNTSISAVVKRSGGVNHGTHRTPGRRTRVWRVGTSLSRRSEAKADALRCPVHAPR